MRGLQVRWLAAEAQALDDFLVFLRLGGLQVVEELAALVDQLHEPATRGVVALVRGEVVAEAVDALGQQRDLDFGRAGVIRPRGGTARRRRLFFQWRETSDLIPQDVNICPILRGANSTENIPQSIGLPKSSTGSDRRGCNRPSRQRPRPMPRNRRPGRRAAPGARLRPGGRHDVAPPGRAAARPPAPSSSVACGRCLQGGVRRQQDRRRPAAAPPGRFERHHAACRGKARPRCAAIASGGRSVPRARAMSSPSTRT